MSTIKLGINGLGRIGRTVIREFEKQKANGLYGNLEIVAVNNPGKPEDYIHLMKYDSLHGKFPGGVLLAGDMLTCGSSKIKFFSQRRRKTKKKSGNLLELFRLLLSPLRGLKLSF